MSIEAMKQALESLELAKRSYGVMLLSDPPQDAWKTRGVNGEIDKSITFLRQAIAEASQNGLYREGYRNGYGFGEAAGKRQAIAEVEKQEPVGWIDSKGNMICTKINESCKPLYTTPQKRPWAGLTDEEVKEFAKEQYGWEDLLKAVEAKFKEKNL